MSRDSSINKTSVLIVAVVVVVGIFSTMGDYTDSSWAGDPYPTDGYEKIDGRYVWDTTLAEKSQGYEWLGFETVNGKVTIQPHEKETDQVEVKAIVKIKKKFWGSEESVMDAKKKTGVEIVKEKKKLLFKVHQPKYRLFKSVDITVDLLVKAPERIPIRGKTVNGTVSVESIDAPLDLHSVNGSIKTKKAPGPIQANTVNGTIRVENIKHKFTVETVNGTAELRLEGKPKEKCSMKTVNGKVALITPKNRGINLQAKTLNGRVIIDGHDFKGERKKNSAKGKLNGGGFQLYMEAVNGNVTVGTK